MQPAEALAYAYKTVHAPPDWRDDIVQDAMLRLCEESDKFDPTEHDVWLAIQRTSRSRRNFEQRERELSLDFLLDNMKSLAIGMGYGE